MADVRWSPEIVFEQGLLHTGKGLISLAPFHSDRALLRPTALAALLVTGTAALDFKNILLEKYQ